MKKAWIIGGIVALLAIICLSFGSCVAGKYNQIVTLNESVSNAWAQVENVLQRRNDLIPNLVNVVQGYATHEQATFQRVAEARASLGKATTVPQKVEANNLMTAALGGLMLVVERYPDLKANQNFMALQDELAGTENRIAVERMRYNDAVKAYNTYVRVFPGNLIAGMFGYARENVYFKADEGAKTAPKVEFQTGTIPPATAAPAPAPAPATPAP